MDINRRSLIGAISALAFSFAVAFGADSPYYGVTQFPSSGIAKGHISGYWNIAGSSSTSSTYTITLDGPTGIATAKHYHANGLSYQWPSSFNSVPTVLTNNGFGNLSWESYEPLSTNMPIGSVFAYSSSTCPSDSVPADGSYLSTTTYSQLYGIIGCAFGCSGATFKVPDIRGYFVRGWDSSSVIDPYRVFGSTQTDAFQGHYHQLYNTVAAAYNVGNNVNVTSPGSGTSGIALYGNATYWGNLGVLGAVTDGTNGTPRISSETRPTNIALNYCISYRNTAIYYGGSTFNSHVYANAGITASSVTTSRLYMSGYITNGSASYLDIRGGTSGITKFDKVSVGSTTVPANVGIYSTDTIKTEMGISASTAVFSTTTVDQLFVSTITSGESAIYIAKPIGVKTGTPSTELEVNGTSVLGRNVNTLVYPLIVKNYSTGGAADVAIQFATGGGAPHIGATRYQSAVGSDGLFIRDTAGLEIARFARGGNVGIGTTSPAHKLDVAGDIRANGTNGRVLWALGSNIQEAPSGYYISNRVGDKPTIFQNKISGSVTDVAVNSGNKWRFGDSATPTESLEVNGNILAQRLNPNVSTSLRAMSYSTGYYSEFTNDVSASGDTIINNYNPTASLGNIIFKFKGTENVRFKGSGEVGIGTTTPVEKLSVNGNIKATYGVIFTTATANGVSYTFPSSQGGTGTVLQNNGSGGLTWASMSSNSKVSSQSVITDGNLGSSYGSLSSCISGSTITFVTSSTSTWHIHFSVYVKGCGSYTYSNANAIVDGGYIMGASGSSSNSATYIGDAGGQLIFDGLVNLNAGTHTACIAILNSACYVSWQRPSRIFAMEH